MAKKTDGPKKTSDPAKSPAPHRTNIILGAAGLLLTAIGLYINYKPPAVATDENYSDVKVLRRRLSQYLYNAEEDYKKIEGELAFARTTEIELGHFKDISEPFAATVDQLPREAAECVKRLIPDIDNVRKATGYTLPSTMDDLTKARDALSNMIPKVSACRALLR